MNKEQKTNLINSLQRGNFLKFYTQAAYPKNGGYSLHKGYYYAILLDKSDAYPGHGGDRKLFLFAAYAKDDKQLKAFPTPWELIYTYECFIESIDRL